MKTAALLALIMALYSLAGTLEYATEVEIAQARATQIAANE